MAKKSLSQAVLRGRKSDPLSVEVDAVPASRSKTGLMRRAYSFDFTALRDGRDESGRGAAFTGRPGLAAEIGAAIQAYAETHSPPKGTIELMRTACSHLWLSLDEYEERNPGVDRIDSIAQLPGEVWISFCRALSRLSQGHAHSLYACMTMLLRRAEPDMHFPAQPFVQKHIGARRETTDPYSEETAEAIKSAFRKDRYALLARIENANALADKGDAPAKTLERYHAKSEPFDDVWTPENTLRFVRDELLPELPNQETILRRYGVWTVQIGMEPDAPIPVPVEGQPIRSSAFANGAGLIGLYRHFVPTYRDLVPLACEAIALDGANPQCVLDYDREDCMRNCVDSDLIALHSRKSRAQGKVIEFISSKQPDSHAGIIATALRVTKPLSAYLDIELDRLPAEGPRAGAEHLEFLQKRVWLTLKARDVGVGWLRQDNDFRRAANEVLTRHQVKENGVQVRWDSRRFRDRKAATVFDMEKSLEQVRIALNQSCLNMPDLYVTTPARKRSDAEFLRQRFEDLASFRNWPKLPAPPANVDDCIEFIVTAKGREWLPP
uniref:hypothetical protein n=1 Tax=Bradyrhizobium elkanii TaxID=29448 RepID=UPI00056FFC91